MKVLVLGAAGQLGRQTAVEWHTAGHQVSALTRADLDVTAHRAVLDTVARLRPEILINCTACNAVEASESDPLPALATNAWAVRSMATAARTAGTRFIHYSTDFVFDGEQTQPYVESDEPSPQSVYGSSKLLGEWLAGPEALVLRVASLFGGTGTETSIDRMLASFLAGRPVTAFADRTVSPSYVNDVARATRWLVERSCAAGVYHCVNSGQTDWLQLAAYLRELAGCPDVPIAAVPAASVPLRARRPQFAALSNAKLVAAGAAMPDWRDALRRHVATRLRAAAD